MLFIASKLLSFAIEPLFWVLLLLSTGLVVGRWRQRLGRRLQWAALGALLVSGWSPLPDTLLRDLELRYPPLPPDANLQRYVGVVVLGGALAHSDIWTTHDKVALNDQAERMTEAVALARRQPHLKLLFTGGIASVRPEGLTEAARAKIFFDQMGIATDRVVYEDRSRNTAENARYSATLAGVDPRQPWLLLTSANHMPRSMGVFLKAGWNVTPYPVDFRSSGQPEWLYFSLHNGPGSWQSVLHELLGYQVYRWRGLI
jgi:uncharacterized SAM-binding protein YcdF (DUF218 family)